MPGFSSRDWLRRGHAALRAAQRRLALARARVAQMAPVRRALADLRRRYVGARVRHIAGPRHAPGGRRDLVVLCLARDGASYVRSFVEHYRRLGARHIVILDNGSTDDTVAQLRRYAGVTVLGCALPFKTYQNDLRRYLIRRFGSGRWCLYVDIDELFDYPASDRLALPSLLRYLDLGGYTAVVAQMIDMFSDRSLGALRSQMVYPLHEHYPYYDLGSLERLSYARYYGKTNTVSNPAIDILVGGVRKSAFGVDVWLTKHPLMFIDRRIKPMLQSSHTVDHARVADISCALLHYKFLGNFPELVDRGVREGGYYLDSQEYKQYRQVLDSVGELQLKREGARELRSVDDLLTAGALVVTADYLEWVERHGGVVVPAQGPV